MFNNYCSLLDEINDDKRATLRPQVLRFINRAEELKNESYGQPEDQSESCSSSTRSLVKDQKNELSATSSSNSSAVGVDEVDGGAPSTNNVRNCSLKSLRKKIIFIIIRWT